MIYKFVVGFKCIISKFKCLEKLSDYYFFSFSYTITELFLIVQLLLVMFMFVRIDPEEVLKFMILHQVSPIIELCLAFIMVRLVRQDNENYRLAKELKFASRG